MEQTMREYSDRIEAAWPEETETERYAGADPEEGDPVRALLRLREEEAGAPLKTRLVPIVNDFGRCLRDRFLPRIIQILNDLLAGGDLSQLLNKAVVSEQITSRDMELQNACCWRLNRTDFLADIDLHLSLVVLQDGRDIQEQAGVCLSLWFTTEEGFSFEFQELHRAENKPDRSFWKLDRFLVPVLRDDEIETGSERLWEDNLPDIREPKQRTARMLAEKLGLAVAELRLYGQNRVRSSLWFQEGTVLVQEEKRPGEETVPEPVSRKIAAGTIVLNTAAACGDRDLDILHECIHYEWHLLFYRLQKLMTTSPLEIRYRKVQSTVVQGRSDPLRWMEYQARNGSLALCLPQHLIRTKAWRLYQEASAHPSVNGYQNHPGFRWYRVIMRLSDEYRVRWWTVRRRLVRLGYRSAIGAVNYVDGRFITPFAFTPDYSADGRDTLVISREGLTALYRRSPEFRRIMGEGSFVYADGHVCLNDSRYLRATREGARMTPWANAHADACCLRFEKIWLDTNRTVWIPGSLNSSEDYLREYDRFLDRRMSLNAGERLEMRSRLMNALPNSFPEALRYLMEQRADGRVTTEELARLAQVSRKTVERYRGAGRRSYDRDIVVAICIALHLPPWLSRIMLEKAGYTVASYGPCGYYGEILDCCFMDTVPEIQEYLRASGYPPLKLQES